MAIKAGYLIIDVVNKNIDGYAVSQVGGDIRLSKSGNHASDVDGAVNGAFVAVKKADGTNLVNGTIETVGYVQALDLTILDISLNGKDEATFLDEWGSGDTFDGLLEWEKGLKVPSDENWTIHSMVEEGGRHVSLEARNSGTGGIYIRTVGPGDVVISNSTLTTPLWDWRNVQVIYDDGK